jgi:phosphoribosylformylglycinamidine synthase PurS subunit
MKTIELHITLQPQVLDTQGQTLTRAVHDLGYAQVNDIRVGKVLYMTVHNSNLEKQEPQISFYAFSFSSSNTL